MKSRILIGSLLVIAIIAGGFAYTQFIQTPSPAQTENSRTISVTFAIESVLPAHAADVAAGTTVLELLRAESAEKGFTLAEKEYAGLGILVEQIGEYKNGTDSKYWHYYVNGKLAPVGVDAYVLQSGDAIEWKFHAPDESL